MGLTRFHLDDISCIPYQMCYSVFPMPGAKQEPVMVGEWDTELGWAFYPSGRVLPWRNLPAPAFSYEQANQDP